MMFILEISAQAEKDFAFYKKSGNKAILKKLILLLKELTITPFEGTGKPELLKHELAGKWSRRLNHEHRLIYEVLEQKIIVHSARGHYY